MQRHQNPRCAPVEVVGDFLASLFAEGKEYSTINSARSAISSFLTCEGTKVGSHPLITEILKGVQNLKPQLPRHCTTWDPAKLLEYLENMTRGKDSELLFISKKVAVLFWLLSGQRGQTIFSLDIQYLSVVDGEVRFWIPTLLKTSKPGKHLGEIAIKGFPKKPTICLVSLLEIYLQLTKPLRGETTKLFLTTQKPFSAATQDSITRWVRVTLTNAGIDKDFNPHSIRAASTSAAARQAIPIDSILKNAGWATDCMFRKYYKKPIRAQDKTSFSEAIYKTMKKK